MLKFFRKYNKIILAVSGAFLMVAFLAPTAIQRLGADPRGRTVARVEGVAITAGEFEKARLEFAVLESIRRAVMQSAAQQGVPPIDMMHETAGLIPIDPANEIDHWYLLSREAQRGGYVGGPQDGRNFLRTLALWMVDQIETIQNILRRQQGLPALFFTPENRAVETERYTAQLDEVWASLISSTRPEDEVNRAFAKAHGVARMLNLYVRASQLSDLESMALARRDMDEVEIEYALLPTERLTAQAPDPTEAQLRDLYEQAKDFSRGAGPYGLGYTDNAAIRLESIVIARDKLQNEIALDPVEVYAAWEQSKLRFGADFDQARPAVEADLRRIELERAVADATQIVKREVLKPQAQLDSQGERKTLPPDWPSRRASFEDVVKTLEDELRRQYGVEDSPVTFRPDRVWWTASGLESGSSLAEARLTVGPRTIPFSALAFSIFNDEGELVTSEYGVQPGLTYRTALRTGPQQNGDVVFFRIVDTRPVAPAEFDAIRQRLTDDWRRVWAFNELASRTDEILEQAADDFIGTAQEYGVVRGIGAIRVRREGMQALDGSTVDERVNNETVRNALMERAAEVDPTVPIDQVPMRERILAAPVPDWRVIALLRITKALPAAYEIYRIADVQLAARVRGERDRDAGGGWPFTFENLSERFGWERVQRADDDDDSIEPEDAESDPGADA